MSITFCPLASGSKGNALFLGTPKGNVLFDAGVSAKVLKERLETLGVGLESIRAIIVSHEHHDHIAGIKTLCSRYAIPVIANYATAEAIVESIGECPSCTIFTTGEPFEFLGMEICPFSVRHDGVDPTAFTVRVGKTKVGICTDIGFVTETVRHELRGCNVLYIEANHEPSLVFASSRPEIYKQRVLSRTGHLSNEEAAQLICDVAGSDLRKVYLAHLSSECNAPETARRVVSEILQQRGVRVELDIAHQDERSQPLVFSCVC